MWYNLRQLATNSFFMLEGIKIVFQYLRPFKRKVVQLVSISLLAAMIGSAIPWLYGFLVDQTLTRGSIILILSGVGVWLILSLVNGWLNRYISLQADKVSIQSGNNMVTDMAQHYLHLPFSYLKEQKVGKIINRIDRASSYQETIIEGVIFSFLPDFLTMIFILVILATIQWSLSLILLLVLIFYVLVTVWQTPSLVATQKKMNRAYGDVYGYIYEALHNYETIKAFAAEAMVLGNMSKKLKRIVGVRWFNFLAWNRISAWQTNIFSLGFVGLFSLGLVLLSYGQITPGNLISFIGYIAFIFGVLGSVTANYSRLNRGIAEIKQGVKLLKVKTEAEFRDQGLKTINQIQGRVRFRRVSFKYPGKKEKLVLNNINFDVRAGEVIALVGESGAGKSTLVDLISGYYLPTRGSIIIDDFDTKKIDGKSLRQHIAVVPQEVSLFHETIAFNIRYGRPSAKSSEIEAAAISANADKFIRKFPRGYKSKVGERGVKLSVGQKQRVAIARALLRDPDILILDEATSSLDSVTEKLVQEALNKLIKNRTTFIIAHRLSTITHADRIFVFDQGRIVEMGQHQALLQKKNGVYKRLYEAQKF